ncbi:MAG: sulfotransferase, partial [Deltaproteobacteria bacterium]|nr:sulfotransferase [Deltaproteobacteria bacterium]
MNMDQLIKAAYDRAQVEQIPSESFREGLAVLLEDINASSKVTEQGLTILEEEIIGYLVSRLQVDDHVRQHPELLEVPIEKPVVVLGMPRSGTTLLSYLLAADPARRSILRWQLSNPVPPAPADRLYDDPRCLAMKEADAQSVATSRKDLHYEPADGATECVFAQAQE